METIDAFDMISYGYVASIMVARNKLKDVPARVHLPIVEQHLLFEFLYNFALYYYRKRFGNGYGDYSEQDVITLVRNWFVEEADQCGLDAVSRDGLHKQLIKIMYNVDQRVDDYVSRTF